MRDITGDRRLADRLQRLALEDHGDQPGDRRRQQDAGDGRTLADGEIEDHGQRQQDPGAHDEGAGQRVENRLHPFRRRRRPASRAHHQVDQQAQAPGGHGRPQHVPDVVEQVGAGGHRGQVRGIGERGQLVAEVSSGHDGTRCGTRRHAETGGHAH